MDFGPNFGPILSAMVGGGIPSIINLREDVLKPRAERAYVFQTTFHTWLYFLLWPGIAGFMVWAALVSETEINALQALYIGVSAPAAIEKMIKAGSLLSGGGPPPNSEN